MSEGEGKFPCSICETSFSNPRDLGKHILTDHCNDDDDDEADANEIEDQKSTSVSPQPSNHGFGNGLGTIIEAHLDPGKSIIMAVDPLEHGDMSDYAEPETSLIIEDVTSSESLANLPRSPTSDEQKQKFMIASSASPSTEPPSSRYICLVCGKAYTSRYNIRCHLNMHSGKNVHSCPYCNRFFAHKHVFDSHLRTHTGERPFACTRCGRAFSDRSNCSSHQKKCRGTDIIVNKISNNNNNNNNNNDNSNGVVVHNNAQQQILIVNTTQNTVENSLEASKNGNLSKFEPQIVSVKSMSELCAKPLENATSIFDSDVIKKEKDDLEEIQIEPDITDFDNTTVRVPHITLPVVPLPRQTLTPIRATITPASILPKQPITLIVPIPVSAPSQSQPPQLPQQPVLVPQLPVAVQQPPPPTSTYTCSFCNVRFNDQKVLIGHLSSHVTIPSPPSNSDMVKGYYTFTILGGQKTKSMCLSCGKTFNKEPQVKIHLNVHNGDNIYNCRFCEKVFANYAAFEEHVKTHSEEYKFNCKFCNTAFMNRNVMVSHQKTCPLNNETPTATLATSPGTLNVVIAQSETTFQPPPEKRFKVVLNSDEIKNLIRAKDEEIRKQEEANRNRISAEIVSAKISAPMVTIPTSVLMQEQPVIKHEPINANVNEDDDDDDEDDDDDDLEGLEEDEDEEGVDPLENSMKPNLKPNVRKRAPVFPFEPEDHYVPDNNSNNVIDKSEIVPPPTAAERAQGYCLRPFKNGQQRYVCIVCGKHYTTTYNMRQHRNIHTGRGLHCCRYCGRDFTHKHVWETHERIHTGERPFKCSFCPKDFADRSNYNSHRKLCAMNARQAVKK